MNELNDKDMKSIMDEFGIDCDILEAKIMLVAMSANAKNGDKSNMYIIGELLKKILDSRELLYISAVGFMMESMQIVLKRPGGKDMLNEALAHNEKTEEKPDKKEVPNINLYE